MGSNGLLLGSLKVSLVGALSMVVASGCFSSDSAKKSRSRSRQPASACGTISTDSNIERRVNASSMQAQSQIYIRVVEGDPNEKNAEINARISQDVRFVQKVNVSRDQLSGASRVFVTPSPSVQLTAAVTGTRKILVLPVNFEEDDGCPVSPTEISFRMFNSAGRIQGFYRENSYGQLELQGRVLNWWRAPRVLRDELATIIDSEIATGAEPQWKVHNDLVQGSSSAFGNMILQHLQNEVVRIQDYDDLMVFIRERRLTRSVASLGKVDVPIGSEIARFGVSIVDGLYEPLSRPNEQYQALPFPWTPPGLRDRT